MTKTQTREKTIVSMRPADWQVGENTWQTIVQKYSSLAYTNLFDFQKNLWGLFKENPTSIRGLPVLVIADINGAVRKNYPYPATILKGFEEAGHLYFTVTFHPIEEENWGGEKVEPVRLYQVIPVMTPKTPSSKVQQEVDLSLMLTQMNLSRNSALATLRTQEQNYLQKISSLQRDLSAYESQLVKVQKQLKEETKDFVTTEGLKKLIDELAQNKQVAWAMLTKSGKLVVETTTLYPLNQATNKVNKRKPIGRIVFCISPRNNSIEAENLDYAYIGDADDRYGHPNLFGHDICLGGNEQDVHNMLKLGKFYDLIDFMILFFSLFPHDSGRPFKPHSEWLAEREDNPISNPWKENDPVYKVSQNKRLATRIERQKKKLNLLERAQKKLAKIATAKIDETTELENLPF